ncbi:MAG: hypothetical protein QXU84_01895, partial [Candidatus Rehaiarchaeum fermentans]
MHEMSEKGASKENVRSVLKEILEAHPEGMRYSDLIKAMKEIIPKPTVGTLQGKIGMIREDIKKGIEKEIIQPEKGVYILAKYLKSEKVSKEKTKVKEEEFYEPFADYLVNDLEECTRAIPLGGNKFGDKWGTLDVLGVYKFSEIDTIKASLEIVSAEIKTNTNQLITAFGQACAYKLFSHKVYLVIPNAEQDVGRIESLCLIFGIGLVLFDPQNPENPKFTIRTRAVKSE